MYPVKKCKYSKKKMLPQVECHFSRWLSREGKAQKITNFACSRVKFSFSYHFASNRSSVSHAQAWPEMVLCINRSIKLNVSISVS